MSKEQKSNNPQSQQLDIAGVRRSCLNCEFFKSFRDDYFDDMEPDDEGFCKNGKSKYFGNEGAGYGVVCEFHNCN
jgi:hypothetical protein